MHVWIGAFLVFSLIAITQQQQQQARGECIDYDPLSPSQVQSQLLSSTYTSCSPFVGKEIFISYNVSQEDVANNLTKNSVFQLIQDVKSILPISCYKHVMSVMCQSAFPSCVSNNPVYPCQSMCESSLATCGNIWGVVGLGHPFDCNTNPVVGSQWPTTDCSSSVIPPNSYAAYTDPVISRCPSVYAKREDPDDDEAPCALRCPDPGYTHKEFDSTTRAFEAVGSIALILEIYLLCSYMIDHKKRQFPARIQPFLFISILGLTIACLMSGPKAMCANSTTYSTQDNNSLCATQAFFMIFFAFCAILWVLALSFVTYLCVVQEIRPFKLRPYEKYIHLFVWSFAFIFMIVICSTHSLNFGYSTRTYCFLKVDASKELSLDYPLFYIPATVLIGATFIFFAMSLAKLVVYRRGGGKSGAAGKTTLKAQHRIMIVIAILIIIFGAVFGFRYGTTRQTTEKILQDRTDWVNCKVRAELLGLPYPSTCNTDTNPLRRSVGTVLFQNIALATIGIFIFFTFGTDRKMLFQWITLIRCLYDGDYGRMKKCILHGYSTETNSPRDHASQSPQSSASTGSVSVRSTDP